MHEDRVTAFGGIVGRVLADANSISTGVTAFILGAAALTVSYTFGFIGGAAFAQLVVQVVISVALARFALNGMSGEFRGTILSTAGGSWALALMVALRYLVLSLVAFVPLAVMLSLALAGALSAATAQLTLGGAGGGEPTAAPGDAPVNPLAFSPLLVALLAKSVIASGVLMLLALTLLPPIFLIVALRTETFRGLFSKEVWLASFRGRFADLYVIYAIHAGGVGMLIMVAVPVILFGFSAQAEFGILFGGATLAYLGALAITLLGRLCGFFAFGDEAAAPGLRFSRASGGGRLDAPPAANYFKFSVVAGGAPARPLAPAAPVDAAVAGTEQAATPTGDQPDESGRAPLTDGEGRAAAARARFATDRDGALADLIALRDQHAANAHVVHALALSLHEAGFAAEGLETARAGIPLCLQQGQASLAADLFAAHWKQARDLGLDPEQIDAVAGALFKRSDLTKAVAAYGMALTMDPADRKAVKGLLQAADQRLHKDGRPKDAARIYTFLLQYAPDSPFADDMKRGLAEAEARLTRAA